MACPSNAFLTSDYSVGYAHDLPINTQLQLGGCVRAVPGTVSTVLRAGAKPVETGKGFGPPIQTPH